MKEMKSKLASLVGKASFLKYCTSCVHNKGCIVLDLDTEPEKYREAQFLQVLQALAIRHLFVRLEGSTVVSFITVASNKPGHTSPKQLLLFSKKDFSVHILGTHTTYTSTTILLYLQAIDKLVLVYFSKVNMKIFFSTLSDSLFGNCGGPALGTSLEHKHEWKEDQPCLNS